MSRSKNVSFWVTVAIIVSLAAAGPADAQTGTVRSHQKISDTEGNLTGALGDNDFFGASATSIGDLNGDGVRDIAVGAPSNLAEGSTGTGSIWILFLDPNGDVNHHQKVSDTQGNFTGTLELDDGFGNSLAFLGDLDNDGTADIAVGANGDDDGGSNRGAVWVLFLDPNGMVKSHQKISYTEGNFSGTLDDNDRFGKSVTLIGDLRGDGTTTIAVGVSSDDDGGLNRGAVWVLFLDPNGLVKSHQKISDTQGNFTGSLGDWDSFGKSVVSLGDLDGDGITDIAVGSNDGEGTWSRGGVWILFLNSDGTVKGHQKISDSQGDFTGTLANNDWFGSSVGSIGDLNGDGVNDLAVGAIGDDDEGGESGAVWILFLDTNGMVRSHQKISGTEGDFTGTLDGLDWLGHSVTLLGDLNSDGVSDIAVGACGDDDGGESRGAVWVLFLYDCLYDLKGDMNNDCKVSFPDFAMMAGNWLIDCDLTPGHPACIPK